MQQESKKYMLQKSLSFFFKLHASADPYLVMAPVEEYQEFSLTIKQGKKQN
jgi:hypothetical protein